jgi:ribosomal protein S18 acetylase RimI-like enzyme
MKIQLINNKNSDKIPFSQDEIAEFLFVHLDEFGDKKADILKCLTYVFERGGFLSIGTIDEKLAGVVVMNETGMSGYIPEYILVYIAVNQNLRGHGIGKKLMEFAIHNANGNIALHVEPENPAKRLYERLGFTNKYLEMRLIKK